MLHAIWLFAMAIAITIIIIFFDFLNTSDLYIQGGYGVAHADRVHWEEGYS